MKCNVLILLIGTLALPALRPGAIAQETSQHPRLISVTGTSEIEVAPDEVILTVAVQTRDKDLSLAKSQHDTRVKKVMAQAKNAGIDPKYIQTSSVQMYPEYSEERVPRFLDYQVTQTIQLTLKDLSTYESLLSKVIEGGVNRVEAIEFRVSESRKYKDEARLRAIRAAKEKANAMATELGQTIGKPWEINEQAEPPSYPYQNAQVMAGGGGANEPQSTVAPGQLAIRASIRVSFQLE
jgi:uncharacterized protein YggE